LEESLFFPSPGESLDAILAFFQDTSIRRSALRGSAVCAAIPLGIFTATIVSRLRFLGVRAAGTEIAFFGGLATALNMMASSSVLWTMSYPGIAQEPALLQALYRLTFALGGPGFSVPFGLLIAGVSVTAGFKSYCRNGLSFWRSGRSVGRTELARHSVSESAFLNPTDTVSGICRLIAAGFALPNTVVTKGTNKSDASQLQSHSSDACTSTRCSFSVSVFIS